MFTTAADAIADNEHVCKIVWNSNGIDIARLVNTHRTNIDKEGPIRFVPSVYQYQ